MPEAKAAQATSAAAATELTLLDQIVEQGRLGKDPAAKERGKDMVKNFVSEVLAGQITVSKDTEVMINARIAQIDHLISLQLNEIMHAPEFQKLEGSWRGLRYMLGQSETSDMLKIKILNVGKKELLRDLQRAPEFDQSAMFKKVYEEEYGVFGGAPFGALVGDYEFDKSGQDIELLEKVAQVAAASHAPFITGASPEMLNLESFTQLDSPRDLAKVFDTTEYARWKAFHRPVVPALRLESKGFGIDAEITAKVARGQFHVFEVPVSYFGRSKADGKKIRLKDGFAALTALVRHTYFPSAR